MAKLIGTVGKILVKEGFQNIKINKVSEVSGVSKKMIYTYFGGIDGLIKAYLRQVDFWKSEEIRMGIDREIEMPDVSKEFMFELLKNDFHYFFKSSEMQKIVLWGISERNKLLQSINDERERLGEKVFEKANDIFKDTNVDYRATIAIFISSIYYLVLYTKKNGSTVCGINMATDEGKDRILKALDRLLGLTYKYAEVEL